MRGEEERSWPPSNFMGRGNNCPAKCFLPSLLGQPGRWWRRAILTLLSKLCGSIEEKRCGSAWVTGEPNRHLMYPLSGVSLFQVDIQLMQEKFGIIGLCWASQWLSLSLSLSKTKKPHHPETVSISQLRTLLSERTLTLCTIVIRSTLETEKKCKDLYQIKHTAHLFSFLPIHTGAAHARIHTLATARYADSLRPRSRN